MRGEWAPGTNIIILLLLLIAAKLGALPTQSTDGLVVTLVVVAIWVLWAISRGIYDGIITPAADAIRSHINSHPTAWSCVGIFVGMTILTFITLVKP
jgi:hypothetical protein